MMGGLGVRGHRLDRVAWLLLLMTCWIAAYERLPARMAWGCGVRLARVGPPPPLDVYILHCLYDTMSGGGGNPS